MLVGSAAVAQVRVQLRPAPKVPVRHRHRGRPGSGRLGRLPGENGQNVTEFLEGLGHLAVGFAAIGLGCVGARGGDDRGDRLAAFLGHAVGVIEQAVAIGEARGVGELEAGGAGRLERDALRRRQRRS